MDVEQEVRKLKEGLQKLEVRVSKLEGKPGRVKRTMAISEFFQKKKPKSVPNRVLAIAYYLQEHKDFISFNLNDLRKGFRSVGVPAPDNPNDPVLKNVGKGYFAIADEEKEKLTAWYVTDTGCKYVENGFKKPKGA